MMNRELNLTLIIVTSSFIPLIIFFIFSPIIIIYLEGKYKVVSKVGAVLICYGVGILIGNTGLFPKPSEGYLVLLNGLVHLPLGKVKELAAEGLVTEVDAIRNSVSFLHLNYLFLQISQPYPRSFVAIHLIKLFHDYR